MDLSLLAVVLLVAAVLALAALDNWQYTLLGLLGQYLILAYLLAGGAFAGLGIVRLGLGLLVTVGLYLSLRDTGRSRHSQLPTLHQRAQRTLHLGSLSLAAVVMAAGAGIALSLAYPWPGLAAAASFAGYFLAAAGLMILLLPVDLLRHGYGLLLLENAAHLLRFSVAESADLIELALTGVMVIVLALVLAHLVESAAQTAEEEDTGEA